TLAPTPSYRVIKLHAPVLSVFIAADAQNAVVLHADSGPTGGPDGGTTSADGGTTSADGGTTSGDGGASTDAAAAQPPGPRAGRAFSLVPLAGDLPARIQT